MTDIDVEYKSKQTIAVEIMEPIGEGESTLADALNPLWKVVSSGPLWHLELYVLFIWYDDCM